ncbi:hypothetical protein DXA14_07015 [Hungatella hathewayi]|nr:hypothetical protein DXA14_07015 [Hungatella hathewayi]
MKSYGARRYHLQPSARETARQGGTGETVTVRQQLEAKAELLREFLQCNENVSKFPLKCGIV